MPSPKTTALKLERTLNRLNAVKVISDNTAGPNRAERRASIQRFCKKFHIPYEVARGSIRDIERRMAKHGIDPHDKDALKQLEEIEKQQITL